MAHPINKWGIYHIQQRKFLASYPRELEAYHFAFGYLEEYFRALERKKQMELGGSE